MITPFSDLSMFATSSHLAERALLSSVKRSVRHAESSPEQRLMIALVRDSIRCVNRYRNVTSLRGKRLFDREANWILSDDRNWLYAFAQICDALDLDPRTIRRSLGLGNEFSSRQSSAATCSLQ